MAWSGTLAPFGDGDRWGINCAYVYGELDRVFWMHRADFIPQTLRLGKDSQKISEVLELYPNMEIISLDRFAVEKDHSNEKKVLFNFTPEKQQGDQLRTTTPYPKDKYFELMGGTYATSSIMYAIGLAILEGYTRIRLYGLEAFSNIDDWEYGFERQGIEHLCWLAHGKNIVVEVPFITMVTASNGINNLYGYKHKVNNQ